MLIDLESLKSKISEDKLRVSRFATRFIMVKSIHAWQHVVHLLQEIADERVFISSFCPSADAAPASYSISYRLGNLHGSNVIVLAISEVLRLFGCQEYKQTMDTLALIENNNSMGLSSSTRRVYVPMICANTLLFEGLKNEARFSAGEGADVWEIVDTPYDSISVSIFPSNLSHLNLQGNELLSLQAYLVRWEKNCVKSASIVTEHIDRFSPPYATCGFDVIVYHSAYDYLQKKYPEMKRFDEAVISSEIWISLLSHLEGFASKTLKEAIQLAFHLSESRPYDLLQKWKMGDAVTRLAVWIMIGFLAENNKGEGIWEYVLSNAGEPKAILSAIEAYALIIPKFPPSHQITAHKYRINALDAMQIEELSGTFWNAWSKLDSASDRLKSLSFFTRRERSEGIGLLFKDMALSLSQVHENEYIKILYPSLHHYTAPFPSDNLFVLEYFNQYRLDKLRDYISENLRALICEWYQGKRYLQGEARASRLATDSVDKCVHYWDCIGAEWVPMLCSSIMSQNSSVEVRTSKCIIAKSDLPSITALNQPNREVEHFSDKTFDALIHQTALYPEYIVLELEQIDRIATTTAQEIDEKRDIILTSDHGSSRMAVLEKSKTVEVPKGTTVFYFGRYADAIQQNQYEDAASYKNFTVMLAYQRFSVSGNCGCENHGGGTPEESLVPYIEIMIAKQRVVSYDQAVQQSEEANWHLTISKPAKDVFIEVNGIRVRGLRKVESNAEWTFHVGFLSAGVYNFELSIIDDNNQLMIDKPIFQIAVLGGIKKKDMRI